ncbi:MAG: M23 family metallopeptidase [Candidatus Paceibacterota bacterium]
MQLHSKKTTENRLIKRRITLFVVVIVLAVSIVFSCDKIAKAGLISFMSSLVAGESASAKINRPGKIITSQNITLLAAAANRDPNPDGLTDIVPIDDESLVPDLALSNSVDKDIDNTKISTYVVREGDTVSSVAKMFNVSVNTILWANNIGSKSVLKTGQTLVILPISGLDHTVIKGENLQSIAKKYNADTNEILAYNDLLVSSKIFVGQHLIIPNAELAAPQIRSTSASKNSLTQPLLDGQNWPTISGYFIRPVVGGTRTQGLHGHNGIDIAGPVGTPIRASASGTIIINRMNGAWNGGYGNYIVISHSNGTQTLYGHMQKSSVVVGEKVLQGEVIGSMGSTGLSTGPHVHFEIRGARNPF